MDPEMKALAERAVVCGAWRWMPGMLLRSEHNSVRLSGWGWDVGSLATGVGSKPIIFDGHLPDFTDPATLGCLLALVREAHGQDCITPRAVGYGDVQFGWKVVHPAGYAFGNTEAQALVAALEAAKR